MKCIRTRDGHSFARCSDAEAAQMLAIFDGGPVWRPTSKSAFRRAQKLERQAKKGQGHYAPHPRLRVEPRKVTKGAFGRHGKAALPPLRPPIEQACDDERRRLRNRAKRARRKLCRSA